MGDRWTAEDRAVLLDGEYVFSLSGEEAERIGLGAIQACDLIAEVLNGDPRTNPPKVEMVPWAEVDTRPGKHLPAEGDGWNDLRTRESAPSLTAYKGNAHVLTYGPGSSVPVRSSDGEQA